ncbi:MAG: hypothetical protein ABIJ81_02355 [Patescibacteria group bacterium]
MDENQLKNDVEAIKERNKRVEADKAWELSWTRRFFITAGTYVLAGLWLSIIEANNPWQNAFVPTLGYLISTLTLPIVKRWWLKRGT